MNKNILIIEDDPFTQRFYKYIFSKSDYSVTITEDGESIFDCLRGGETELIIMDINLRNTSLNNVSMDGVQLSRIIKNEEKFSHIPIILVTAYQMNLGDNNFLQESLADDYIIKPIIDFNELLQKVDKLINK